MYFRFILPLAFIAFTSYATSAYSSSKMFSGDDSDKKPAMVEADEMNYDKEKMLVIASGNVQVVQGSRVLVADKVTYDKKNDSVRAEGHVSLTDEKGNVFFGDSVQLKGTLKQGFVDNFSARFSDNTLIAAKKAEKVDENVTVLQRAVYSPCSVCKDEPTAAPLWQFKARKATIDEKKQKVVYRDAFFEVKGVPVLYTPYMSHATPGADRKSGFLVPKYSSDKLLGTVVELPYYYNIAPDKDLILTPIITSNEGPVLAGEYRQMLKSGSYSLAGSITNPDQVDDSGNGVPGQKVRGHVEGKGEFNINDVWMWGFDGKRSSDDTYLRRYHFGEEDVLTSKIYTVGIKDRDHTKVEAITFQGLSATDDPGKTPLILPHANSHWERYAGFRNSKWTMDADFLALKRDEGVSSNRESVKAGWELPYLTKSGHIFTFKTSVRGDNYFVDNVPENVYDPNSETHDGQVARVVPEAEAEWKYPLMKNSKNMQIILEPTTDLVVSPYGGNPNKIPNEDSQDVEFSDENLFDANHYTGLDRIENGPRVNYGLRGGIYNRNVGDVGFLFGQNYKLKEDSGFSDESGLGDQLSDYVGRISYQRNKLFNIAYKFRLDKDNFLLNRSSLSTEIDVSPVKFNLDYVYTNDNFISTTTTTSSPSREIVIGGASWDVTKNWTLSGNGNRNLADGEWVATRAELLYKGDCVNVGLSWLKEYTSDRDIRPDTSISLRLYLKNFGTQ